MEEAAKNTTGIKDAQIGFMTQKMIVEFEDGADVNITMDSVIKACKKVEPDCNIFVK
ncbi:heavy-metal-associated domain-containing protein [Clostridium estertheticum]|nr:heavy-metal-associated domain-containing protein [Clostridium estertheticum]WAG54475.1 heavy-metal-associated domain-containing protein [Clostridium estertheticum]